MPGRAGWRDVRPRTFLALCFIVSLSLALIVQLRDGAVQGLDATEIVASAVVAGVVALAWWIIRGRKGTRAR